MEEEKMVELTAEGTLSDISKKDIMVLLKRFVEEVDHVSKNQLSKEEGGRRFTTALVDFGKSMGIEDADPTDFDDPDYIVVAEETMDFMVRLRQRLSAKTISEIREILQKMEEEID